ncbi:MAG: Gldg family protein [Myxococcota bacterium]
MALSEAQGTPAPTTSGRSAPVWIFALYLGGLVTIYFGERVLSGLPKGAGFFSLLGVLATLAATVLRFSPRFRSGGERRNIESLLALLSVVGLVGVLVYFATSEFGVSKLGLDRLATETRARVEEFARVAWISLIAVSTLPMIFAETALLPMQKAERPESRRVRSAATSGLVLALAAIYCSLFVYAASGVDLKVDYSYFKTSKPSDSTRKMVQTLSGDPIRVVAFFPEVNEVRREVSGYLKDLASGAPKLKVELRDRLLAPKLAQELRATQDGVVILSRGGVNHTLNIGTDLEQARAKLKTLDRDFQEQLVKIANSKRTVYVTVGHGELGDAGRGTSPAERGFQIAKTLLQQQNYSVKDLGMAQGLANDVPEDADAVLVLGPTIAFSPEEVASLKRYLERGGHLFVALDPDALTGMAELAEAPVTNPAAEAAGEKKPPAAAEGAAKPATAEAPAKPVSSVNHDLAALVGLRFSPGVLANEKQHVRLRHNNSDRIRLVTNSFSSHASVSTLSRNSTRFVVVAFGAGSLDKAPGSQERVDFTLRSLPGTFADENKNFSQDQPVEKAAVFNLAAAYAKPLANTPEPAKVDDKDKKDKDKKPEPKETRVFAVSDSDAFSDFVMTEVVGNRILLVDAVRWLAGESSVQGLPNTEEDVRIEHTKQADLGWFYATIFGAPSLVLGAGVLISRRSRQRGGKR